MGLQRYRDYKIIVCGKDSIYLYNFKNCKKDISRWVSASTGALCIVLYLPYIFQEKYIAVKEREFIKTQEKNEKVRV